MSPLHTVGAGFDERRNTSRTWEVTEQAVDDARRWTDRFRVRFPRMLEWLEAGAPAIHSEQDHVFWFGVPYKRGELT